MSLCEKTHPHAPHFWRDGTEAPNVSSLTSCPGVDVEPLAPEQDRPVTEDTPDWEPDSLHLTDAAAIVVRAYQTGPKGKPSPAYYGAMACWRELTGLDEAAALTYAFQIATLNPPTVAYLPPF